jgi:hypothetical protein
VPGPSDPGLADTGAGGYEPWLGAGALALVALGSAVLLAVRRRSR